MNTTILKEFTNYILQPYLYKNIISIINNYNNPLQYYILIYYDSECYSITVEK